jgi:hypothetical protein
MNTMTLDSDDQRWVDVLAGRAEPVDAETRQAAHLRKLVLAEQQKVQTPESQAAVTRMMNILEARGAFKVPPQRQTALQRFKQWLGFGDDRTADRQAVFAGRRAALATLAVCALALPIVVSRHQPDGDDNAAIKGLPGQVQPPRPEGRSQLIRTAQARQDAEQLLATLAQLGVAGQLETLVSGFGVDASIPTDRLAAAQAALSRIGLVVPADGQLRVHFEQQP